MENRGQKVVIVGAGPTGLSAAILLRLRGYDPLVLERRSSMDGFPAAHVANTRTLEVFAEIGVAERVWAEGDTDALSSLVVWVESMAGREFGILRIQGTAHDTRGPLSAFRSVNIAQTRLEAILYDRFIALNGTIRFGQELVSARNHNGHVELTVRAQGDGEPHLITCDWLLGCDGAGSAARRSSQIAMEGPATIARFMTIYFTADLDRYRTGRRGLLYWIGGCEARGVFINFDKAGRTWAMLVPIGDLVVEDFSDQEAITIVQKAIGEEDAAIDLMGVSSWNMSAQVAASYRNGHIILAGDACHRFPPTGGLGMNTGVQDAQNLIWKLCAVMAGEAHDSLIDSYEEERRPIAQRNTDQSVHNLLKMAMIDRALGIETLAPIAATAASGPFARYPSDRLGVDGDGEDAIARRHAVHAAIDQQAEHFAQGAGIDLGFSYETGIVVPDGSLPPSTDPCAYRPDAHPGARLPFSSPDGSFARSTLGHVRPDGVTLFGQDARWRMIAEQAGLAAGVMTTFYHFGTDALDLGPMAADLLGIEATGAVAVRPDGHVLWRLPSWQDDAEQQLTSALSRISGASYRMTRSR